MIGQISIWISFGLSVLLTILFFIANGKEIRLNRFARIFYYALPFSLLLSSAYLMYNIMIHNYQFTYIWSYSNNFLPTHILFTTFFSGQEGSFLLWAVLVAFFALFVRKYARKYGYEELVMAFFSLTLVFITFMLILKSPFDYVWQSFPDQGIDIGFMPPDGRGLNPILENFWNMIHPPILFIGYAAMTVPFVFAIAALIKRDYQKWIEIAAPWTLFATGILGLGIMLGGFWSYETLGWGGFWAWDPVENASLMPWLIGAALVHSMLVQRKSGTLVKTNFLLAMLTFIFVLFSTFLTRSGILGEMSVHSFGEPGAMAYAVLLGFLVVFLLLSIVLLLIRLKDINAQTQKSELSVTSREFALSLGMIAIILSTFVVLIGTTLPITSGWFSASKASVDISFYDKWNLPIAIVIMVLNGISFYMRWKNSEWKDVLKKSLIPGISALVATVLLVILQIDKLGLAILAFAAIFSIIVNTQVLIRIIQKTKSKTGSMLSHIGIGILIIGVIFSGTYSQKEAFALKINESTNVFGYKATYLGNKQIEKNLKDREKYEHTILFEKNGSKTYVNSILYWSDFNNREQVFLEPGIKTGLTKDIYVSPVSFDKKINLPNVYLDKNIESKLPNYPNIKVNLTGFDMSGSEKNSKGEILFGAIIDFNVSGYKYQDTIYTWLDMESFSGEPVWYPIDSTQIEIGFSGLKRGMGEDAVSSALMLIKKSGSTLPAKVETFTFQVETKPFMYLVWIGSIFVVGGLFIAITKYRRKEVPTD